MHLFLRVFVTLQLCRPVAVSLIPFLWETEMLEITVLCELLYCPGLCFSGASIKVNWLLGEEWWPSATLPTHTLFPVTDRMVPRYTTPLDSTQPDGRRRRRQAGNAHTNTHRLASRCTLINTDSLAHIFESALMAVFGKKVCKITGNTYILYSPAENYILKKMASPRCA